MLDHIGFGHSLHRGELYSWHTQVRYDEMLKNKYGPIEEEEPVKATIYKSSPAKVVNMVIDKENKEKTSYVSGTLSRGGIWEYNTTKILRHVIKEGDVAIDCGAHIGYYTLTFAEWVGDKGKVFSFEPSLKNLHILEKNIALNGYKNVTLIKKAVSNKDGSVRFFSCPTNSGDNRILTEECTSEYPSRLIGMFDETKVDGIKLDTYCKDFDRLDFIKLDVQGAEYVALSGAKETLNRFPDVKFVTEFWPPELSSFISPIVFLKMLMSWGFSYVNINDAEGRIDTPSPEELVAWYTLSTRKYTDLHTNLFWARDKKLLKEIVKEAHKW
jgi:FkbM family methyltransferase